MHTITVTTEERSYMIAALDASRAIWSRRRDDADGDGRHAAAQTYNTEATRYAELGEKIRNADKEES